MYGFGNQANIPFFGAGAGIRTPFGILLPPSGNVVAYVRGTNGALLNYDGDSQDVMGLQVATLNQGLLRCKANRGDFVIVLPGHTENVSVADQMSGLVAGTKIIGLGQGNARPKLTWSAATSTFLLDQANVVLDNFTLEMAGDPTLTAALSVAAPITVSAAGCTISNCLARVGVDADQLATIALTTTAAADDLTIAGCRFYGATASGVTTVLRAVGADRLRIAGSQFIAATTAAGVGVLQFLTTASTDVKVNDCEFVNKKSDSTAAITGLAGCTGTFRDCGIGYYGNAGIGWIATTGDLQAFNCFVVNEEGEASANAGVVSA